MMNKQSVIERRAKMSQSRWLLLVSVVLLLIAPITASATTIDFGFFGGAVNYAGGNNPLTITNSVPLVFSTRPFTGSTMGIYDGDLDLITGNWLSGTYNFNPGGSFTLIGDIPTLGVGSQGSPVTLATGSFSGIGVVGPSLTPGLWSFIASVNLNTLDPVLASLYGFPAPGLGTGLSNVNLDISFVQATGAGPGIGFNGYASSGDLTVSPVPEPGSLLFLGSGLLIMGFWVRKLRK
jgi:hypothetical protein